MRPKEKSNQEDPDIVARTRYVKKEESGFPLDFTKIEYPDGRVEEGLFFRNQFLEKDKLTPVEIEILGGFRRESEFIIMLDTVKMLFVGRLGKKGLKNFANLEFKQLIALPQSKKFEDTVCKIEQETGFEWKFGSIFQSWISLLALVINHAEKTGITSWTLRDLEDFLRKQEENPSIPAIPTPYGDLSKSPAGGLPWTDPHISMDVEKIIWDLLNDLAWMEFAKLREELEKERKRREKAEKRAEIALFSPSPTVTKDLRSKVKSDWDEEIVWKPELNTRGEPTGSTIVEFPLKPGVSFMHQTTLNLEGLTEKQALRALNLNPKTIGWTPFDAKIFDLSILFAYRHPDRSGVFNFVPKKYGRLLYPDRHLGVRDYERIQRAMTKLTKMVRLDKFDRYEVNFRLIAEYADVHEKAFNNKGQMERIYAGGIFQIFAGIWKQVLNLRQIVLTETKAYSLPDQLYAINWAIKCFARINWNKGVRNTGVCRIGLTTLIDSADISVSPTHERRVIEKLHESLNQLTKENYLADWWIQGARGGSRIGKSWCRNESLTGRDGSGEFQTKWEGFDKVYYFKLTEKVLEAMKSIPEPRKVKSGEG